MGRRKKTSGSRLQGQLAKADKQFRKALSRGAVSDVYLTEDGRLIGVSSRVHDHSQLMSGQSDNPRFGNSDADKTEYLGKTYCQDVKDLFSRMHKFEGNLQKAARAESIDQYVTNPQTYLLESKYVTNAPEGLKIAVQELAWKLTGWEQMGPEEKIYQRDKLDKADYKTNTTYVHRALEYLDEVREMYAEVAGGGKVEKTAMQAKIMFFRDHLDEIIAGNEIENVSEETHEQEKVDLKPVMYLQTIRYGQCYVVIVGKELDDVKVAVRKKGLLCSDRIPTDEGIEFMYVKCTDDTPSLFRDLLKQQGFQIENKNLDADEVLGFPVDSDILKYIPTVRLLQNYHRFI